MKTTFLTIICLVYEKTVNADKVRSSKIEHRSIAKAANVNVVNHEFCSSCLSEEDKEGKENLKDVHTYAELKSDPRADLPSSFTICSSVMTTYNANGNQPHMFNMLGNDGNSWLAPIMSVDDKTSFYHWKMADVKLPPVFAHQWVRSCVAVNSESGLLQWVVDGTLVQNAIIDQVRGTKTSPVISQAKLFLELHRISEEKNGSL